jgi:pimeloyl-ACP methyl ester carboxylesterase
MKLLRLVAIVSALVAFSGCSKLYRAVSKPLSSFTHSFKDHKPNHWERYGKVYYLDGAGNLGYGQDTVPKALRAAGYRGDIEIFSWTTYTGPIGDQMIRVLARKRAEEMTRKIINYRSRYPDTPVYIIGLSAGTGVGVWAVENLPRDLKVDIMVLLSSSLSTNYNMTDCLKHVKNKVFVLSSPHDYILKSFIHVTGTIDGAYLAQPAGLAGMYPKQDAPRPQIDLYKEKIVNVPWRPTFERLGNDGGHTAATSYPFLKYYICPKLLGLGPRARTNPEDVVSPETPAAE